MGQSSKEFYKPFNGPKIGIGASSQLVVAIEENRRNRLFEQNSSRGGKEDADLRGRKNDVLIYPQQFFASLSIDRAFVLDLI